MKVCLRGGCPDRQKGLIAGMRKIAHHWAIFRFYSKILKKCFCPLPTCLTTNFIIFPLSASRNLQNFASGFFNMLAAYWAANLFDTDIKILRLFFYLCIIFRSDDWIFHPPTIPKSALNNSKKIFMVAHTKIFFVLWQRASSRETGMRSK